MRLREVVQPLINKARGNQCEICLSRKQLQVQCVHSLESLAAKFDEENPDEEFDQIEWKTFWIRHQRYRTICLACATAQKEEERKEALKDAGLLPKEDDPADDAPDWGPIYLTAASQAILMNWYRQAQEKVFGKGGRKRRKARLDISDDEGEDIPVQWADAQINLSEASQALAIRWLRTARANIQKTKGADGSYDPKAALVRRSRQPQEKYKSGKKSKTRRK